MIRPTTNPPLTLGISQQPALLDYEGCVKRIFPWGISGFSNAIFDQQSVYGVGLKSIPFFGGYKSEEEKNEVVCVL